MDPTCQYWLARNFVTDNSELHHVCEEVFGIPSWSLPVYFSSNLPPKVHAHLTGTSAAPKSDYISFAAERGGYFAKHTVGYGWSTDLQPIYENMILSTREDVGPREFDTSLKCILFGMPGTVVIVFDSGFIAKLQGECTRLRAAFEEFNAPGWTLEHGSALSMHNEDHYFLKFAKEGVPGVQIRANMPDFMNRKFLELMKQSEEPNEQHGEFNDLSQMCAVSDIRFRNCIGTTNDFSQFFPNCSTAVELTCLAISFCSKFWHKELSTHPCATLLPVYTTDI
jgi:hypothetical protein